MDVKIENIDALNAIIKVKISNEDYNGSYESSLKNYKKPLPRGPPKSIKNQKKSIIGPQGAILGVPLHPLATKIVPTWSPRVPKSIQMVPKLPPRDTKNHSNPYEMIVSVFQEDLH